MQRQTTEWPEVPRVEAIGRRDFYGEFVAKGRPVVIQNLTSGWKAARDWNLDYFRTRAGGTRLAIKTGDVSRGRRETVRLSDYIAALEGYEQRVANGEPAARPGYLHDVPFFHFFPELKADIEPFPLHLFPEWYWERWPAYIQYFMGPSGSVTPLHFDTLMTNNIFFQVVGRKRFILVPANQKRYCYLSGWRWARFDPSAPDYEAFPLARQVTPVSVEIGPGDILYIPSGTLHHVTSLSHSISFNIDWHTARSARQGALSVFRGAPWKNGYYNLLCLLGVGCRLPSRWVFPLYKSYLSYVS